MATIKDFVRNTGLREIATGGIVGGQRTGWDGDKDIKDAGARETTGVGERDMTAPPPAPEAPAENTDPLKQRIKRRGRRHVPRLLRLVQGLFSRRRELTPEEQALRDEKARRKEMERLLREEASIAIDTLTNALNNLGLCYRYKKSERDMLVRGVQSIKFEYAVMQPEAIYLKINTRRMPRGVNVMQVVNDNDVLNQLGLAVGRRVTANWHIERGAWLIVERAAGVMGVPSHVKFREVYETFPQSADELTIPLGMARNSKRIYRSLKDFPHLLIAGATDSGKSNMMNVVIGTLILRNHPDLLKLILVDLKGGMEFSFYEGLPHLLYPITKKVDDEEVVITDNGIIDDRSKVPDLLAALVAEGERRMDLLREAGHKKISTYNARRKHKLPRIVLVIDEWADVRLEKGIGTKAESYLSNLASRMRAVGIHVIVATQSPKKEVISTIIKTNLPAKFAFSCPTYTASELIIDNGEAKGLTPQGRFIFQKGNEQLLIQSPYMPDTLIKEIVAKIIRGETDISIQTGHDVTPIEILEYALDNLGGKLPFRELFEHFRVRGLPRAELVDWLKSWDNQTFAVRENVYRVENRGAPNVRRLLLVTPEELVTDIQSTEPDTI